MTVEIDFLLRSAPLSPSGRARLAVDTLKSAIAQLLSLHEAEPDAINHDDVLEIEDAQLRLARLLPRLRMKRSLVHLTGAMGRTL
jgi:hypothetical protein